MSDRAADRFFRQQNWKAALDDLKEGLKDEEDGPDQLLYLLDLGLVAHTAGEFQTSNHYLLKAESIAEIKDYTSLANEAATLLVSDNIKHYKGEDFEKVLIHVYLAMNFAEMGNLEGALVEARKVNRVLRKMIHEGKRKYELSAFAFYLSGLLYEAKKEFDNAYVSYKKAYRVAPNFDLIQKDLLRLSRRLNRPSDLNRWEKTFRKKIVKEFKNESTSKEVNATSELIVFFENGISPIKVPHRRFGSIPVFRPRRNPVVYAEVKVNDQVVDRTQVLEDIEKKAIHNLNQKYAGLIAKKVAGAAAKIVVGDQVEKATDSRALGVLTKIALFAADRADVRSWNLLPKDLQVARIALKPGTYRVGLKPVGDSAVIQDKTVTLKADEISFLSFRYIPF